MPYMKCSKCEKYIPISPGTPSSHNYRLNDPNYVCDDCKDSNKDENCVIV